MAVHRRKAAFVFPGLPYFKGESINPKEYEISLTMCIILKFRSWVCLILCYYDVVIEISHSRFGDSYSVHNPQKFD